MTVSVTRNLTLEDFLKLPSLEESPAWEYIDGVAIRKPMPKLRHSLLKKHLLFTLDRASNNDLVLPELRCTFGDRSIVPDLSVIALNRIPFFTNELGEPEENFLVAPAWLILFQRRYANEILSPDQNTSRAIDNILHCLRHDCQLGWLVDPDDRSILTFLPQQEPQMFRGDRPLPVLENMELSISAAEIFNSLKLENLSRRH